jgi:hypothetical protein
MDEQRPPAGPSAPVPPGYPGQPYPPQPLPYGRPPSAAEVKGEFPVQAARFSVYSALFAFAINCAANQGGRGMPWFGHLLIAGVCFLLIVSGFILGIVALVKNRGRNLPGVRGYAITGIAINGFFLLANVLLFGRLLIKG